MKVMNLKVMKVICSLLVLLLGLQSTSIVSAKAPSSISYDVVLKVNDKVIQSDSPPFIYSEIGLTMVPIRFVTEALGAKVEWKESTNEVYITKQNNKIIQKIGSKTARLNGTSIELGTPAELRNDRTMVPLRFVSEGLGAKVLWNGSANEVNIVDQADNEKQKDLRAAWISTVYNIDWPSKAGLSVQSQKAEYVKLLDSLKNTGINAVFVQVRPESDAFYPSKLVPWSKWLTGVQGKDPGYDPLAFMVEETHKRGMEFHAWFNPFRASNGGDVEELASNHPAKTHSDWIVKNSGKLYLNPGIPAVRSHIIDTIMEVVKGYNVDGVHLDDYFYPYGSESFDDAEAFAAFNTGKIKNIDDWRRDNVNQFVRDLYQSIKAVKKNVEFGISPFGVWKNQSTDPTGSATTAGVTAYDSLRADVRTWIRNGWLDYVAPQVYWSIGFKAAAYDKLVDWWANETRGRGVKLYIGHAPYKLGTNEAGWSSASQITDQLNFNKKYPEVTGSIYFSAKNLLGNVLGIQDALKAYYTSK